MAGASVATGASVAAGCAGAYVGCAGASVATGLAPPHAESANAATSKRLNII